VNGEVHRFLHSLKSFIHMHARISRLQREVYCCSGSLEYSDLKKALALAFIPYFRIQISLIRKFFSKKEW